MQTIALSENAVAVLRLRIKGLRDARQREEAGSLP